jgi:hypothetical protein
MADESETSESVRKVRRSDVVSSPERSDQPVSKKPKVFTVEDGEEGDLTGIPRIYVREPVESQTSATRLASSSGSLVEVFTVPQDQVV